MSQTKSKPKKKSGCEKCGKKVFGENTLCRRCQHEKQMVKFDTDILNSVKKALRRGGSIEERTNSQGVLNWESQRGIQKLN